MKFSDEQFDACCEAFFRSTGTGTWREGVRAALAVLPEPAPPLDLAEVSDELQEQSVAAANRAWADGERFDECIRIAVRGAVQYLASMDMRLVRLDGRHVMPVVDE